MQHFLSTSHGLLIHQLILDAGRTVHIHTVVLTNYTTNDNGTLGQEAGHIQHIGQGN